MNTPKILNFNINVKDYVLCDQYYEDNTNELIPTSSGYLLKREACYNPLFFNNIKEQIDAYNPMLVCITTQEYQNDHYFHKLFLPEYMDNYDLLSFHHKNNVYMSIYVLSTHYEDYYSIKKDDYVHGNNVYTIAQYIESPFGVIVFIGLFKQNQQVEFTEAFLNDLLDELLRIYATKSISFYVFSGFIDKYNINGNVLEADHVLPSQYKITEVGFLDVLFKNVVGQMVIYELKKNNTTILCFSWNTDKTPLCDQYYENDKDMNKHVKNGFFRDDECYNPLFFNDIKDQIVTSNPDIVAITTEGDVERGTFFHAEFLRRSMKGDQLNYNLLTNKKVNDIGYKQTLRMSIYIRYDVQADLVHPNRSFIFNNEDARCNIQFHNQRQVLNQIDNKMAYTTKKISSDHISKSFVQFVEYNNEVIAFVALELLHEYNENNLNECLNKMLNKLVSSKQISYIFVMGDFSYVNNIGDLYANQQYKLSALKDFTEGQGYYVEPNYQLQQIEISQRPQFVYQLDKYDHISWHDRIYHRTNDLTSHHIDCLYYDNVFGFPMIQKGTRSQHLGIMGVYELTSQ